MDGWDLCICADPGGRAHFIESWINGRLAKPLYDVGLNISPRFVKFHTDWNNENVRAFIGKKIRIRPSLDMIDTHMYLFLTKNVYTQIPDYPRDGIGLESIEKILEFAKGCFYHDCQIDHDLYDHVMRFEDTYDTDKMVNLYHQYNHQMPTDQQISVLEETNALNRPKIDLNHCCSVAAMILRREEELNLPEIDRYWSLRDIYQSTPVEILYQTVYDSIQPDNYGRSEYHQQGINSITKNFNERKRNETV